MRLLILALALTLSAISARAQEPLTLRFAGDLTDLGDQPIRGPVDLHFSLYDVAEGGVALWTETHAGYTPSGGAVSVALGSIQALPRDLDTDQRLFLGVRVGDDVEIAPRTPLGGSLRALTADRADQAERAVRADVALTADDAADVLGREIHPASVSIGDQEVIDAEGRWVGPPVELPADLVAVELSADPVFRSLLAADLEAGYGDELRGPQGIGVEVMTVNSLGELVVTLTNGVRLNLGRIVGETGLQGDVGPQGQRGAPGDQGAPGPEGPAGPRGFAGDQGARGPEGPRGVGVSAAALNERGELVLTWTDASTEVVGNVVGLQGPQGEPGAPGLQGAQGDPGEPGAPGEAGPQGAQGPPGAQGVGFTAANLNAQGELILQRSDALEVNVGRVVGAQGPQGAQGPRGSTGERGVGVSSAELNAEGELVITTTDQASLVVGSVIGATGAQGPAGQRGERGERGEQGLPGNDGGVGPQGPQGLRGFQGLQGPQGDPGPAGPMGPAGNGIDFTQDSDDDGFPDWIESALLTDPLLADSKPADDNANGIADLFESSAAGGGNTFYVPPGDALNVSWKLTNESLGDASNPESLLLQKLEAIRGIRVIRGDLVIGSDDLAFVELPNLEEVQGSLILDADTEVRLTGLRVVGQDVIYRETRNLSSTALPALEQVGGDLAAYRGTNSATQEYTNPVVDELPALIRVEGRLSTGIVAYPRLSYAGSMTYKYRGTLENAPFTFPALEVVSGKLTVGEYTTMLPSMPLLREVEELRCDRTYLTTLKSFPNLTDGAIIIQGWSGNQSSRNRLTSIEGFPALERSPRIYIVYNNPLTSIGAIGVEGQVLDMRPANGSTQSSFQVYGNASTVNFARDALSIRGATTVDFRNTSLVDFTHIRGDGEEYSWTYSNADFSSHYYEFQISYNHSLASLNLVGLTQGTPIRYLNVHNNNQLPQCIVSGYDNLFTENSDSTASNGSQAAACTCTTQPTGEVTCQ